MANRLLAQLLIHGPSYRISWLGLNPAVESLPQPAI
jgi:hypothetical protein